MSIKHSKTAQTQDEIKGFTFSHKNTYYLVTFHPDRPQSFDCRECSWNPWHGYRKEDCCAGRKAQYIAGRMIRCGLQSGKPCFDGEHYVVELEGMPGNGRLRVKKSDKPFLVKFKHTLSILLRFAVQMLMCAASWGLLLDDVMPWVQNVLKCADSELARLLVIALGVLSSALMFALDKSPHSLWEYGIQALLPIGAVYVVGILWVYPVARIVALIAIPAAIAVAFLWHRFILNDDFPLVVGGYLRTVAVVLCLSAVLPMLYLPLQPIMLHTTGVMSDESDREQILLKNLEAREHLEYWAWMALTNEKKLEYAQSIVDYECVYTLGIAPVPVCAAILSDPDVRGTYNDSDRVITIQYDVLCNESPSTVLRTLLHETRHAYQYRVVDMYEALQAQGGIPEQYRSLAVVQAVESFYKEQADYCSPENGFDEYYEQVIEQDSRKFASDRIRDSYAVNLGR